MHSLQKSQITYLKTNEILIEVSSKYAHFADTFLPKLAIKLFKHPGINNHTIELINNLQLLYNPIYSLGLIKLEILKVHIKNNPANSCIRSSKFPTEALILFNKKLDKSLRLCINN